jgi:hypothetical protein
MCSSAPWTRCRLGELGPPLRRVLLAPALLAAALVVSFGCAGEPGSGADHGAQDATDVRARADLEPAGDFDAGTGDDLAPGDADADTECEPGTSLCQHTTLALLCDGQGRLEEVACVQGFVCVEPLGCLELICEPGAGVACVDSDTTTVCSSTGTALVEVDCTGGRACDSGEPGACVARECGPAAGRCLEDGSRELCDPDGLWAPQPPCEPDALGTACFEGQCLTLCQVARRTRSYLGCEYWAADLGNHFSDADDADFDLGFVVTNAHTDLDAQVRLATEAGDLQTRVVGAGEATTFVVAGPRPRHNWRTGLRRTAYRLHSSVPIAAYQFNPIETVERTSGGTIVARAASTDASMLVPDPVLDERFQIVAWEQTPAPGNAFSGGSLLAVVGTRDDTEVTLVATATSGVGPGVERAVVAGETRVFHLDAWEVLQLTTVSPRQDWTGSTLSSTAPIAVFAGNECARVPVGTSFCDHLEEAVFGLTAWGTEYVATKSWARGEEADLYRIAAAQDGATVILGPPLDRTLVLGAGEHEDVLTREDFVITADHPILVAQFLVGSRAVAPGCDPMYDCSEVGDPSMILLPPVGQFREAYAFLTPDTYQQDFANLVLSGPEQRVWLDGAELGGAPALVGAGPFAVRRIRLSDGPHGVESDAPFGLIVYGYGGNDDDLFDSGAANVSYGYPGGLNFLPLNPKDPQPDIDGPGD